VQLRDGEGGRRQLGRSRPSISVASLALLARLTIPVQVCRSGQLCLEQECVTTQLGMLMHPGQQRQQFR
jgi:hypothetical protein